MNSQSPALPLRYIGEGASTDQHSSTCGHYQHGLTATPTTGPQSITERKSPHNYTTVPMLDRNGQPLAPARPSRVRRWLESGRAHKVWVKGIFAVQLNDLEAATAITGSFALNLDPGETTGVAITRESPRRQMPNHRRRLRAPASQQGHSPSAGRPPAIPPHPSLPPTPPPPTVQQPR